MELVTAALAVFTIMLALRAVLPFALPARAAPFIVAAVAYGVSQVPPHWHSLVQATAVAGLAALVHKLVDPGVLPPWQPQGVHVRLPHLPRPKHRRPQGPVGNRIPRL